MVYYGEETAGGWGGKAGGRAQEAVDNADFFLDLSKKGPTPNSLIKQTVG